MEDENPAPAYDGYGGNQQQPQQAPQQQPHAAAPPSTVVLGMTPDQFHELLARIVGSIPAAPAPAAAEPRNRLRVREPDTFAGDRAVYRTWKSQMERYLATYPQASEGELITVVLSYIRGPGIDEWVNSYTEKHFDADHRTWTRTLAGVWRDLDAAYTDRIAEHSALQRMKELRQRAGHAAEFFQEFEKLMWMAGVTREDRIVLEYLKDAICDRFRQAIHNRDELPDDYEGWKSAVLRLDDNYMREQAIVQSRRNPAPQPRAVQPPRTSQPTTSAPAGTPNPPIRADGTGVLYGGQGQPMEIDRSRTGQCWRCGGRRSQGVPGCQNPWHRPPQNPRAQNATPAPANATAPVQRFRGLSTQELTELMRDWATQEPETFRNAGFGQGPT
ncbi:hypothetical protein ACG7TL_004465 [Trametes sanguinea]